LSLALLDMEAFRALTETGPGCPGRPGSGRPPARQPAWALGLSLGLHLLAGAAIIGYGHLRGYGEGSAGGPPGPPVMTVNLSDWPGLVENGLGSEPVLEEAAEKAEETPDRADGEEITEISEITEPDAITLDKKPAPAEPEISLAAPKREKAAPPPKAAKNSAPDPDREGHRETRAGPAGKAGGAAGSGSSSSGGGGGGGGDSAGYLKGNFEYIKKRIRQHLVYSPQAKRLGIQGTVTVAFIIEADGQARNATVSQTSGHQSLDESALRAVQNASPFPPPPETARIVIPISFSLK